MPNLLSYALTVLLLIIGFIFYPNMRQAELSDRMAEKIANDATILFVDSVRAKGYVDVRDYEVFQKSIDNSGVVFKVTFEHFKKNIQPVYTDPYNAATFQNTFAVSYDGYFYNDIMNVLYPGTPVPADDTTRRYKMHVGDLFNIRLNPVSESISSRLNKLMFHRESVPIMVPYGGMVLNEAP
ncbi:hypothetical protein [Paenibacillus cremeus]|uniref:DUF4320 family protein n=1 Tax=Paenibacillus cremeus TaxID=2163881 RepID=A0A559K599_9BACL|nr:hypothetical protein [Paenibacillus cremeus]TVY07321.1 hypothetical protein FPZ49_24570 [Paenibacillus cremeus]